MARRRMFGKQSRARYVVYHNPRTHQWTVQRVWGSGFGERLIVGSFPSKREAQEFARKRQRGLA